MPDQMFVYCCFVVVSFDTFTVLHNLTMFVEFQCRHFQFVLFNFDVLVKNLCETLQKSFVAVCLNE